MLNSQHHKQQNDNPTLMQASGAIAVLLQPYLFAHAPHPEKVVSGTKDIYFLCL